MAGAGGCLTSQEQAGSRGDEDHRGSLRAFENDPKFNLGSYGYTLRRAKGKGASGFIAYKNEKADKAPTPSSEVEELSR